MLEIIKQSKPKLINPAIAIDLFSGGGGIKTGMIMAGFKSYGVEKDPDNSDLSQVFINTHNHNFDEYGCKTFFHTVQEMYLNGWQGLPRNPLIGHISPVCTHFSGFSNLNEFVEDIKDISAAKASADAIAVLGASYWTLEQVPGYLKSQSYKIICQALQENSYLFECRKIDFYDWGVTCQNRERIFLIAWHSNRKPLEFPPKLPVWGWGTVLEDIELYPQNTPLQWQKEAIANINKPDTAIAQRLPWSIVIERTGKMHKSPKIRLGDEPMWTITKHAFHDHKKNSRTDPFNFYIPNKGFFYPHPRAIARICGFPDWFKYPATPYHYGSIFGYAVPPTWIYHFLSHNF